GENEARLEREDFLKVGGEERRHPRLLAAPPRRPHCVARHAYDAPLLAEEIERLHGLFGEADDSLGREHGCASACRNLSQVQKQNRRPCGRQSVDRQRLIGPFGHKTAGRSRWQPNTVATRRAAPPVPAWPYRHDWLRRRRTDGRTDRTSSESSCGP